MVCFQVVDIRVDGLTICILWKRFATPILKKYEIFRNPFDLELFFPFRGWLISLKVIKPITKPSKANYITQDKMLKISFLFVYGIWNVYKSISS